MAPTPPLHPNRHSISTGAQPAAPRVHALALGSAANLCFGTFRVKENDGSEKVDHRIKNETKWPQAKPKTLNQNRRPKTGKPCATPPNPKAIGLQPKLTKLRLHFTEVWCSTRRDDSTTTSKTTRRHQIWNGYHHKCQNLTSINTRES